MANQIRVDITTKHKMLPMVQECCQNLPAKTFNNRAYVVHVSALTCRNQRNFASDIYKQSFALDPSEVRLSFQIKMGAFKPG